MRWPPPPSLSPLTTGAAGAAGAAGTAAAARAAGMENVEEGGGADEVAPAAVFVTTGAAGTAGAAGAAPAVAVAIAELSDDRRERPSHCLLGPAAATGAAWLPCNGAVEDSE